MKYDDAAFLEQLQALLPPGQAWSRDEDSDITKTLAGCAPELARAQGRADDLLRELDPSRAVEMLDVHERINGLPDPCAPEPETVDDRRAILLARLREDKGHNPSDYEALGATHGYPTTLVQRSPWRAFRAGISRAGEPVNSEKIAFRYLVHYMPNIVDFVPTFGAGLWALGGASVDDTDVLAPSGDSNAVRLTFVGAGGVITNGQFNLSGTANDPQLLQLTFWAKLESGDPNFTAYATDNGFVEIEEGFALTTEWRRYSFRFESDAGLFTSGIEASGAATILLWGTTISEPDLRFECRHDAVQLSIGGPIYRAIGDYVDYPELSTLGTLTGFADGDAFVAPAISFPATGWSISILFVPRSSMDSGTQTLVSTVDLAAEEGFYIRTSSGFLQAVVAKPGADTTFTILGNTAFADHYDKITLLTVWYDGVTIHAAINGVAVSQLTSTYFGGDFDMRVGLRYDGFLSFQEDLLGISCGLHIPTSEDLEKLATRTRKHRSIGRFLNPDHVWDFTKLYKPVETIPDRAHVHRTPMVKLGDGAVVGGISPQDQSWGFGE